jgi:early secretory antigenic target protein ESAT-6
MSEGTSLVNFGSLAGGAQGIMATYRQLQSTLENLESQLAPMVGSWTGDAREAYFQQKKKWDDASAAMALILSQMGSAVDNANSNYQAAENSNMGRWA